MWIFLLLFFIFNSRATQETNLEVLKVVWMKENVVGNDYSKNKKERWWLNFEVKIEVFKKHSHENGFQKVEVPMKSCLSGSFLYLQPVKMRMILLRRSSKTDFSWKIWTAAIKEWNSFSMVILTRNRHFC